MQWVETDWNLKLFNQEDQLAVQLFDSLHDLVDMVSMRFTILVSNIFNWKDEPKNTHYH